MKFNRFSAYFMAVMLFVYGGTTAMAASFTDTGSHWANEVIEQMASSKQIAGYPDGTFKPDLQVTRAEFVTIANQTFGLAGGGGVSEDGFKDVGSTNWFRPQVAAAKAAGYIQGYSDGSFKPNQPISREEAAVIIARLLKLDTSAPLSMAFTDSNDVGTWAKASVSAIAAARVFNGYPDGSFKPAAAISRAEAAVSMKRALNSSQSGVSVPSVSSKLQVAAVMGTNGSVRVSFNGQWSSEPIIADFEITQTVDGGTETVVLPTSISLDAANNSVSLVVPSIDQGTIIFNVSYKGASAVSAPSFTISPMGGGSGSSRKSSTSNGQAIHNAIAVFDGLLLTKVDAVVDAQITKVEIWNGSLKLVDAIPANGSISVSMIGAKANQTLTLQTFIGVLAGQSITINVQ